MDEKLIAPFKVRCSDSILEDLSERLKRTIFPDEAKNNSWEYGTNKTYLEEIIRYWQDGYSWRENEAALNQFKQFQVEIGGSSVHFIYERGRGPNPKILLLLHGWPGSVYEFYELIPLLTDPIKYGGDPEQSFTVVCPSLPGFNFSFGADSKRYSAGDIAEVLIILMRDVLGLTPFGIQGGDWGAFVATRMAYRNPELVTGIHLNFMPVRRDPNLYKVKNKPAINRFREHLEVFLKFETGYQWIQGTKPQTLAYGLTDSPVGLAAWIIEKFYTWSHCEGDLDAYFGKDKIITSIMIYWITRSIGSSFWPYFARHNGDWPVPEGKKIDIPTAYIEFPREILRPPREVAEIFFSNIKSWKIASRGGHFAAFEEPQVLASDVREFF